MTLATIYTAKEHNEIDRLAELFQAAKEAEDAARQYRIDLEEEIIALLGVKLEGSETFDGDKFKITTTGKITRGFDEEAIEKHWDGLSEQAKLAVRFKLNVDTKRLRELQSLAPAAYREIARFMTEKPAKPSVAVKSLGV